MALNELSEIEQVRIGQNLILQKMWNERPTLLQYLRERASGESKSSKEWEKAFPGCSQAIWRSGMSCAYHDIEWKLKNHELKLDEELIIRK